MTVLRRVVSWITAHQEMVSSGRVDGWVVKGRWLAPISSTIFWKPTGWFWTGFHRRRFDRATPGESFYGKTGGVIMFVLDRLAVVAIGGIRSLIYYRFDNLLIALLQYDFCGL